MALNFEVRSATLDVAQNFFEAVVEQFDVFTRSDLGDEIVLDTVGWDPEEKPGSCHE